MFQKTRITLTAWYLLIIMSVSISFSAAIYRVITFELERVERIQHLRIDRNIPSRRPLLDPDILEETKRRVIFMLAAINITIFGASALAGYFLAGRTLDPIARMLEEQNRFVTDASHELRTPITVLKSEIEVNLRNNNMTTKQAIKLLKSNLEEVNNLQTLSDRLIKTAQYQKNDMTASFEKISVTDIIRDAVKKISPLAKSKHIAIRQTISNVSISGDKTALTELFVILLENAVKFSLPHKTISVINSVSDGRTSIRVSDRGTGIVERDLPHIFNRFYRADASRTKSDIPGYGLGLAIAKQIAETHHGNISVTSKQGKGSVFTVTLPV